MTMGFVMSLAGAILSFLAMLFFYLIVKKFSIIGVSVVGAIFHVAAQLLVAWAYMGASIVLIYLPFIALSAIITGIFVGIVSQIIIRTKVIQKQKEKYKF